MHLQAAAVQVLFPVLQNLGGAKLNYTPQARSWTNPKGRECVENETSQRAH